MIFRMITLLTVLTVLVLGAGCSQDPQITSPAGNVGSEAKNGTEVLGPPSIAIASGTGFSEGGVGMVGVNSAQLTVDVPTDAQVVQALLYWAGGATTGSGDNEISLDGNLVQGELIGGPVLFFGNYEFFAYRADVTGLGLVDAGMNTLTVADFEFTGTTLDENNGASILVIYDDGNEASITLRDGLDMAYFGFEPTLDTTVPQVFSVDPESVDRMAELTIIAASVGENRPSVIKVTTSGGDQSYEDVLGSVDGLTWDSLTLAVDVPAGADEVSVQIISTPSTDPRGASLGWIAAGLALQPAEVETFAVTGIVFEDASRDATFDGIEWGIGGVVVELVDSSGGIFTATTDFIGQYRIDAPTGTYTLNINLTDYPDDFNADLATSFDATTVLSLPVTIGPDSPGNNFGFTPRAEQLVDELQNGGLTSNGQTAKYWTTLLRRALIEEQSERKANGHDGDTGSGGGWGHGEDYFGVDELHAFISTIEGMYLTRPYRFTNGAELEEVYDILKSRPRTDEERLYRELLVTELNFAAGFGIVDQADVLGVLISWGESLLAADNKSMDKDRRGDIIFAYNLFDAINTGGGGGVDE
ncbi:MAG: hypothetical protein KAH56_12645 [Candidatus Krumholzibacteria bacterium]|nr:hypothetical protein [Candidatus Krumholzibacteria bacterium]